MKTPRFALLCSAFLAIGCRPEPAGDLTLRVDAVHAYTGEPVSGIDFELERRVLENGVLNGNYQWVGSETTQGNGQAEFHFKRLNVLDYQLKLVSSDWFNRSDFIHPDELRFQPMCKQPLEVPCAFD
jgi:hypothetical protein